MRGIVLVDDKKDYNNWLAQQITFKQFLAKQSIIEPKKLVKNASEF
jgi:heme/copper-type cytochrome/quinol oxidase subunit 2